MGAGWHFKILAGVCTVVWAAIWRRNQQEETEEGEREGRREEMNPFGVSPDGDALVRELDKRDESFIIPCPVPQKEVEKVLSFHLESINPLD